VEEYLGENPYVKVLEIITPISELPLCMLLEIFTCVTWGKGKGANDPPNIF
jgi:hypothetical protein